MAVEMERERERIAIIVVVGSCSVEEVNAGPYCIQVMLISDADNVAL